MGFFDDFGKKISSAGQEAIAKTKELADVAKINSNISDEENKIKTAYSEIGKKYFENHSEDSEEDYEAQIAVIKEAMEKIKAYEQQIVEIKGVVKCLTVAQRIPRQLLSVLPVVLRCRYR